MSRPGGADSWLYRAVRRLFRLSVEFYFIEIDTRGRELVPASGPVVLAANHPNSLMDAVVLATQLDRPITYLARSGLFRNRMVGALLRRCGVVPVYRAQDAPAVPAGNRDAFRACFELLEQGGVIGIFPEGQNAPERFVRDIKTGAARIALGTEARNQFALGVKVVPVGLNFEDRDRFFTRVLVRFGPPLDARDHAEDYRADPAGAVTTFTERIQDGMRQEAVHVHDERHHQLITDIHAIYGGQLLEQLVAEAPPKAGLDRRLLDRARAASGARPDLDRYFAAKQHIADAVLHFEATSPDLVERMQRRVRRYRHHLAQARLRWDFMERPPETLSRRKEAVKMSAYAIGLAPLALWGALHNLVPYWLTGAAARRVPDEAMRAITWLLVAVVLFAGLYTAFGLGAWRLTQSPGWTAAYVVSLPFTGLWTLRYRHELARYNDLIVARNLFVGNRRLMDRLMRERRSLLAVFEQLRVRYLRERPDARERAREASELPGGLDRGD
jgi:glycerol-3-phosphate O-acyltransferase / dihydroxyacetone phosphate acyltransferase